MFNVTCEKNSASMIRRRGSSGAIYRSATNADRIAHCFLTWYFQLRFGNYIIYRLPGAWWRNGRRWTSDRALSGQLSLPSLQGR